MKRILNWLVNPPPSGPKENILLRLIVGGVFIWEGIIKFIFPSMGVSRFAKLGFPVPAATATFVGSLEVVGGTLLILGLLTRPLGLIFMFEMLVATLSTKISMYLGTSPLPLPPIPPQIGIWAVLHDFRSEYSQFLTCLFLVFTGPGPLSLDARLTGRHAEQKGGFGLPERKYGGTAA